MKKHKVERWVFNILGKNTGPCKRSAQACSKAYKDVDMPDETIAEANMYWGALSYARTFAKGVKK